nr:IS1 family transposase [Shigella sp. SHS-1]
MASVSISCPSCSATDGVVRNGKSTLSHYRFNNRDEAISVIREYIEIFYNRQRRHSRLGNISPAAFREKYHQMAA